MMTKNEMTKAANRLAATLAEHHGLKLKHTTALSLLASTLGYPNANTMLAAAEPASVPADNGRKPYTVSWFWTQAEHSFLTGAYLTEQEAARLEETLHRIADVSFIEDVVVCADSVDLSADLASFVRDELLPNFNDEAVVSLLDALLETPADNAAAASWKTMLEDILALADPVALSAIRTWLYRIAGQAGGKPDAEEFSKIRFMLSDAVYMPLHDLLVRHPDIEPLEFRATVNAAIESSRSSEGEHRDLSA